MEVLLRVAVYLEELVSHFLGDVRRNLLDVLVRLQIGATDVERDVRRVDNSVKECQILGNNILHLVGDEDLVAVELDLVATDIKIVLYLREIKNAGEVEGIVHVKVDVE